MVLYAFTNVLNDWINIICPTVASLADIMNGPVWSLGVHKNFSRFLLDKTKKGVVVFEEAEPLKRVSQFRGNIKIVLCSIKISKTIIEERCSVVTKEEGTSCLIFYASGDTTYWTSVYISAFFHKIKADCFCIDNHVGNHKRHTYLPAMYTRKRWMRYNLCRWKFFSSWRRN